MLEPGSYLWSSPHGYQFLRDHTGTADVTSDQTVVEERGTSVSKPPPE